MPKVEYVMTAVSERGLVCAHGQPEASRYPAQGERNTFAALCPPIRSNLAFRFLNVGSWHKQSKKYLARYLSEMEYGQRTHLA
jgi:hypothetical protein